MDSSHLVLFYATLKGIAPEAPPEATKKVVAKDKSNTAGLAKELWDKLIAFNDDPSAKQVTFPSLSNKERNQVHQAAESLGLRHVSEGEGEARQIVVTRKTAEDKEREAKAAEGAKKKPYAVCKPPFMGEDGRMVIQFYRERDLPYGCFSNFSKHRFSLDGKKWRTTEHYFQAMKFKGLNEEHLKVVKKAKDPMMCKNLARSFPCRLDNWDKIKDGIMYDCVLAKFSQHEDIQKILLDTGDAVLVEHTANDSYWADGGDGSGLNMLGVTLMRVRDTIRAQKKEEKEKEGGN